MSTREKMNTAKSINFNDKTGFICDMDGVIYHGNQILPGVTEFIQWLHDENKQYLFLTNNSSYTPRELQQKLARMGLDVPQEHFYTSALATAAFLREQAPGCSVFAIGEAGLFNALYDAGITMNDVNPDYVVVVDESLLHSDLQIFVKRVFRTTRHPLFSFARFTGCHVFHSF